LLPVMMSVIKSSMSSLLFICVYSKFPVFILCLTRTYKLLLRIFLKQEGNGFLQNAYFLVSGTKNSWQFLRMNLPQGIDKADVSQNDFKVPALLGPGLSKMYVVTENTTKTWFSNRFLHCGRSYS
jgi:hypothetical protein